MLDVDESRKGKKAFGGAWLHAVDFGDNDGDRQLRTGDFKKARERRSAAWLEFQRYAYAYYLGRFAGLAVPRSQDCVRREHRAFGSAIDALGNSGSVDTHASLELDDALKLCPPPEVEDWSHTLFECPRCVYLSGLKAGLDSVRKSIEPAALHEIRDARVQGARGGRKSGASKRRFSTAIAEAVHQKPSMSGESLYDRVERVERCEVSWSEDGGLVVADIGHVHRDRAADKLWFTLERNGEVIEKSLSPKTLRTELGKLENSKA